MEYQQIIQSIQNLSGAHVWLVMAMLVFAVCAVLTVITFRQFSRHQDNFREDGLPMEPEAILIDTANVTGISRYTIAEKPVMIGRVEASDNEIYDSIVVPDVTVGRRHAVIEFDQDAFWIQDQGSVNGCFVNGQRIEDRHRLRDGDYIKVHKFTFQFVERFVVGVERISIDPDTNEPDTMASMPRISPRFDPEQTMRPNEVLANHAHENETMTILDIPRHKRSADNDPQRTQVLYRNEMEQEFAKIKQNNNELSDQKIRRDIQDMTVQLFMSPDDDKTQRLYSDLLDGPPLDQPNYKSKTKKTGFSQLSSLPDIDEKVIEALGDFFNDTQDELIYPTHLELTKKGDKMAQMGHFSSLPPTNPSQEKSTKE